MDFKDTIAQLSERILKIKDQAQTEEATKTGLIMPFIAALGYDVFNPMEVCPEYTCDIGTKKGEKIDYAIMRDSEPVILIECKHCSQDLEPHNNQMVRYFNVSKAKFGVLTNGVIYKFYTDLERANVMDSKPFLVIDFLDIKEGQTEELKKFHKTYFDENQIMATASELKYTNALKKYLNSELSEPSTDFIKFFTRQVYDGPITAKVFEQFQTLLNSAISQWKNELVNDRFKAAMTSTETSKVNDAITDNEEVQDNGSTPLIETTEEELQGFYIVRAILANTVDMKRIVYRDAQTYFAILFDDNNRKPICRLYFNGKTKYIETFDKEKKGSKHALNSLEDLYLHSDKIIEVVQRYLE